MDAVAQTQRPAVARGLVESLDDHAGIHLDDSPRGEIPDVRRQLDVRTSFLPRVAELQMERPRRISRPRFHGTTE
jgi:hypothetical protein